MSSTLGELNHVSDTALMVAACRALETESDEGFVHDPFAARMLASAT
jgi:O-methyltransferase involved in polyketide biosynthesis